MNYEKAAQEYSSIVNDRLRRLSADKTFVIAFCGVFSAGKTSLINRLLDIERLLDKKFKFPSGINPVTKVVTRIRYGKQTKFYYSVNGRAVSDYIPKIDAIKIISGVIEPKNGWSEITAELPLELLKNGIEILDTPGYNDEMGGDLERISREAVLSADMVVLCVNSTLAGNMFEKGYIEELDESIGNFILVVNSIDRLNTDDDLEELKKSVGKIMKDRGAGPLKDKFSKNIFYTVADSDKCPPDLDGVDRNIKMLLLMPDLKKAISDFTAEKAARFSVNSLLQSIKIEMADEMQKRDELREKNNESLTKRKNNYNLEKSKRELAVDKKRNEFLVDLNHAKDQIARKLTDLEAKKSWYNFEKDAKLEIANCISYISNKFNSYAQTMIKGNSINMAALFNARLNTFTVPAPQPKLVKRRGTAEATINNFFIAIGRVFGGTDPYDDGYDSVYENYHLPAINEVNTKLIPQLTEVLNTGFNKIKAVVVGDEPSCGGLESEIAKSGSMIQKWKQLKNNAEKYIASLDSD